MKRLGAIVLMVVLLLSTMSLFAGGGRAGGSQGSKQVMNAMFLGSSHDQALVDIINNVADRFNASNQYNAEFRIETYENELFKTRQATAMASNSVPDVFFTWSAGYLKPFVEGGRVYEIGQLLDRDPEWKNRFNEGVFGPVTYNSKIYAVPHGQTVAVMFYNTRLFAENNVSIPRNFVELKAACEVFKARGIVPISVPIKDAWVAGQLQQQLANGTGGMDLFNGTVNGSRTWNDPRYVESGRLMIELVNMGAFQDGYLGMSYDEGKDLFVRERAAMYYMGSWEMSVLGDSSSPVSRNIGVFNIPPNNASTGNVALGDVDQCFAISASSRNVEAAGAFIKIFSSREVQEAFAYDSNYLLSTKTLLDSSRLSPLFIAVSRLQQEFTGVTPWLDRVFGAGEGVEFNNASQAIMAGRDPTTRFNELQQFAIQNARR